METFHEFVGKKKPWKARKRDIVRFWQGLKPNLPILPSPVPKHHKGSRFDQDGIRITGSPDFINGVISRLKDFLRYYHDPTLRLDVEYRQIETKTGIPQSKPVYVFYIHVIETDAKRRLTRG